MNTITRFTRWWCDTWPPVILIIAKAGNDSIVWKRFRRRQKAEKWMSKSESKTWRRA